MLDYLLPAVERATLMPVDTSRNKSGETFSGLRFLQHAEEYARMAAAAMDRLFAEPLDGEPVAPLTSPMRLSWDAWSIE